MSWFSSSPKKLNWWEQLELDYPPGSKWLYLGRPCHILSTHGWSLDGFPYQDFRIQYHDNNGVIHTTKATPSALVRPEGGGE